MQLKSCDVKQAILKNSKTIISTVAHLLGAFTKLPCLMPASVTNVHVLLVLTITLNHLILLFLYVSLLAISKRQ